jgi:uncharacterized protein YjbI with pentapeptide repeats
MGTNFRDAVLKDTDLSHARLDACDMRGADLTGSNMHRITRDGADLSGAQTAGSKGTDAERAQAEDYKAGA